jgi:hypothetical protein
LESRLASDVVLPRLLASNDALWPSESMKYDEAPLEHTNDLGGENYPTGRANLRTWPDDVYFKWCGLSSRISADPSDSTCW